MIGGSAEQQICQTAEDSAPDYWVVAVFGTAQELRHGRVAGRLQHQNTPSFPRTAIPATIRAPYVGNLYLTLILFLSDNWGCSI